MLVYHSLKDVLKVWNRILFLFSYLFAFIVLILRKDSHGFKVTSYLRGVLREKIRTRAGFNKILTSYTSEEGLINVISDKNIL